MNEFSPLTPEELLYSLEKLAVEFGASNARETVLDSLPSFEGRELTTEMQDRLEALKKSCSI